MIALCARITRGLSSILFCLMMLSACSRTLPPLTVVVVDDVTGQPIPSVSVGTANAGNVPGTFTITDEQGRALFTRWATRQTVSIQSYGYLEARKEAPQNISRTDGVTMEVRLTPMSINGSVLDAFTNQPIAGATVNLLKDSHNVIRQNLQTSTDSGGGFSFRAVPLGFTLEISATDYAPLHTPDIAYDANHIYAYHLRPTTLSGVVTDAKTGVPVQGATVRAGDSITVTDERGLYLLQNLHGTETSIGVQAPGFSLFSQPFTRTIELDIKLQPSS